MSKIDKCVDEIVVYAKKHRVLNDQCFVNVVACKCVDHGLFTYEEVGEVLRLSKNLMGYV